METIHDWNDKILALIGQLKNDHPELIGFLDEITTTIPDKNDPEINVSILKEYYTSLMEFENLSLKG
jgi:hypothetical protein